MVIGIDFDNTIVRYDDVFHRVALERGLIPADLPETKSHVRDYLRRRDEDQAWTELQGYVYGARMDEAAAFPGAIEFLARCTREGVAVHIISHKTRYPFAGPQYDLYQAASEWLERRGVFSAGQVNLPRDRVHFGMTKEDKLRRIREVGCTHFIDDLPEFLGERSFPAGVERILFDPAGAWRDEPFTRVASWAEIDARLLSDRAGDFRSAVQRLLARAGCDGEHTLTPLEGGGNNRVFQVAANGQRFLLKQYFSHAGGFDRLATEFEFSRFAWSAGVRCIPRPAACDAEAQMALYDFVDGTRLIPGSVTASHVAQATAFYFALNRDREAARGRLGNAAEAYFTLAGHLDCVERRLAALEGVVPASPADAEALRFVTEQLRPTWNRVVDASRDRARELGCDWNTELPPSERRLSPSDFGFHNALLGSDGRLTFLDFEYAGWDDPAKLAADFFCQPAVPAPPAERDRFVRAITEELNDEGACARRLIVLWAVYQIKWICIVMNEFLPLGDARRRFTRPQAEADARKAIQLAKARSQLDALRSSLPVVAS